MHSAEGQYGDEEGQIFSFADFARKEEREPLVAAATPGADVRMWVDKLPSLGYYAQRWPSIPPCDSEKMGEHPDFADAKLALHSVVMERLTYDNRDSRQDELIEEPRGQDIWLNLQILPDKNCIVLCMDLYRIFEAEADICNGEEVHFHLPSACVTPAFHQIDPKHKYAILNILSSFSLETIWGLIEINGRQYSKDLQQSRSLVNRFHTDLSTEIASGIPRPVDRQYVLWHADA